MQRFPLFPASVMAACAFAATSAFAHAFLERASPGVGATVAGSPSDIELQFSQDVVPGFSGVTIAAEGGESIPTDEPRLDPASPNVLHVHLRHALKPGAYAVQWHVISVDTHPTSGTYRFTVAP
jgi:methionine-rich copper-binding protein CopC